MHPESNSLGIIQPKGFPTLPANWCSETETFDWVSAEPSHSPQRLFAVLHHAKDWKSHRALVILHGHGEHGGRYLHVPHFIHSVVDAVYCPDFRGHGRSAGLRSHVERFDLYLQDSAQAIRRMDEKLKARFGKSEIFVLAHSMGGLIALRALLKFKDLPVKAASISAPLLAVKFPVPAIKKGAGRILSTVWGSLHMSSGLDPKKISHDPEVIDAYQEDRLVHGKVTPRFFVELEDAMEDLRVHSKNLSFETPLQFLIPLEDQIVSSEVSIQFFNDLSHHDKQLKKYPGFYHESLNEVGKERVFEDILAWIRGHMSNA